jgi:hypothetical protein
MTQKTAQKQKWALASYALDEAYTDYILSHQGMLCTPRTIVTDNTTARKFVKWMEANAVISPIEISVLPHLRK